MQSENIHCSHWLHHIQNKVHIPPKIQLMIITSASMTLCGSSCVKMIYSNFCSLLLSQQNMLNQSFLFIAWDDEMKITFLLVTEKCIIIWRAAMLTWITASTVQCYSYDNKNAVMQLWFSAAKLVVRCCRPHIQPMTTIWNLHLYFI